MRFLSNIKKWTINLFGFHRHDDYVKKHLNDANVRSSAYMTFIIIAIEIWMIIRSINKNVIPQVSNGANLFDSLFTNTSLYFLFMIAALTMLVFSVFYMYEKSKIIDNKFEKKINTLIPAFFAIVLVLYSFLVIKEISLFKNWNQRYYVVNNVSVIFLYIFAFLLGSSIIGHTIYRYKYGKNQIILSIIVIIFFSLMCLTFGIKVGYSDFFSRFYLGTGLPKEAGFNDSGAIYEIKSIICFLTMVLYVGCLLIWKPYISIAMLTSIFIGYYYLLSGDPANRIFPDGEKVNYITFLITLCAIAVSIYQQRVREALNSEDLEYNAKFDSITGINNYNYYVKEISELLKEISNYNEFYYLFINIENFKTYNDQMGFNNGTEFLKRFAKKIVEIFGEFPCARESDDHFVAFVKMNEAIDKINELEKYLIEDSNGLYLNLRVGGVCPRNAAEDINTSIDRARYAASLIKDKYNKIFIEYDDEMHKSYKKKQYVINHLEEAIENGYIKAYYQPVVWSETQELCGCEALARWIDPKYGLLSPGEFIPVLEEVRLIHKLDSAIFEIVCKNIRKLMDDGKKVVPVSINFSRLDFELMDAVSVFENLINKYDIPKEYVHVEITESALTETQDLLQKSIDKLHNDGFSIWLDDFGSGYSSLNVLKDFNFDVIKIDMKFLTNFEKKPVTKVIIDSIIKLSEKIGMKTLTEGVETTEQAEFLKDVGCGRLQGYLFGKPIPLEEFLKQIEDNVFKISNEIL